MRVSHLLTLSAIGALVSCGGDTAAAPKVLKITAITDHGPDELREKNMHITAWLEEKTGVKCEFTPVANYAGAVTAIVSGQAHMAWLGGVTTVQAMNESEGKCVPVLTRASDLAFKSYFIVRKDDAATSIQDFKGKRLAFGSSSSTSGHVMPRHFLAKSHGIAKPEEFFGDVAYSGAHPQTIKFVVDGTADIGALNYLTWDADSEAQTKTKILWTTPAYVDYSWTARTEIDDAFGAGTTQKIVDAFTTLDPLDATDAAILNSQKAKKFVAAKVEWWDGIKAVLATTDIK